MYIDLSHKLHADMPLYPGTPKPVFEKVRNVKEHGYKESFIQLHSHTGTHMDAPSHMISDGKVSCDFDGVFSY